MTGYRPGSEHVTAECQSLKDDRRIHFGSRGQHEPVARRDGPDQIVRSENSSAGSSAPSVAIRAIPGFKASVMCSFRNTLETTVYGRGVDTSRASRDSRRDGWVRRDVLTHQDLEFSLRLVKRGKLVVVDELFTIVHESGWPDPDAMLLEKMRYLSEFDNDGLEL